jgi:T5SS/PEP-CTERM-associated repeat protein
MKKPLRVFGMALMIIAGGSLTGVGAIRTTSTSGDWTNNATWGSQYPTNGDTATINGNYTVTLTNNEQIALGSGNVNIGSSSKAGTLMVSNNSTVLGFAAIQVGSSSGGSRLTIVGGGLVTNTALSYVGNGVNANSVLVSNSNSRWLVTGVIYLGSSSSSNSMTIADSGVMSNNNSFYIGFNSGISNTVLVTGGGSRFDNSANGVFVGRSTSSNSLTIADGGVVNATGGASVGYQTGANYNSGLVSGLGSSLNSGAILYVGRGTVGAGVTNNCLSVTTGGRVVISSGFSLTVADTVNSTGNGMLLASGGLLEATSTGIILGNAANSGNYVTNSGGILQFTAATPTITVNNSPQNVIVITNGTVSFRNVALVNLTNNWVNSSIGSSTVAWQGNNTLRLNGTTATNALGYSYQFATNQPMEAKNYVNLEMLGTSAIKGGGVTIGAGGSMLVSNGTVNISGIVTNSGTLRFVNSAVTFESNVVLQAGCINAVVSTNQLPMTVQGVLTVNGGTVNLPTGFGTTDSFTLYTSPNNTILGSVSSLSVSPNSHRAVLSDDSKSIVVRPRQPGFVFMVD